MRATVQARELNEIAIQLGLAAARLPAGSVHRVTEMGVFDGDSQTAVAARPHLTLPLAALETRYSVHHAIYQCLEPRPALAR